MADQILTSSFDGVATDFDHLGVSRDLDVFDKKVKPDISDEITKIDPNKAPFIRFLQAIGNKQQTGNFKFEWLDQDDKDMNTTIASGAGSVIGNATNTKLFTSKSDLYQREDILRLTDISAGTFETVRVVSKTSPTEYQVVRDVVTSPSSGIATFIASDEVLKIGSSHLENSGAADPDRIEPRTFLNFTQTFKSSVEISGRFNAMDVRDDADELGMQLRNRMVNHVEEIENAFLFGRRFQASTRTYTGGFEWFIDTFAPSTNIQDLTGVAFSEKSLDKRANEWFRFGGDRKVAIVGGQFISKLGTFAKAFLQYNDKASVALGMEVMDFHSSHGAISFIHSRTFDDSEVFKKLMIIFDPKFVKKRFMKGRDTHMNMNVQNNDQDGTQHEILSDIGLELRLPEAHFVVKNIDTDITE